MTLYSSFISQLTTSNFFLVHILAGELSLAAANRQKKDRKPKGPLFFHLLSSLINPTHDHDDVQERRKEGRPLASHCIRKTCFYPNKRTAPDDGRRD